MRLIDAENERLLRELWTYHRETGIDEAPFEDATKALEVAPTIGGWIPCSERLPKEPFGCLVTVEDSFFDGDGFRECESILPYFVGWDGTQWNDDDGERCPFEVIAWQPLPEPYKYEEAD